jgi:hypothetical protein
VLRTQGIEFTLWGIAIVEAVVLRNDPARVPFADGPCDGGPRGGNQIRFCGRGDEDVSFWRNIRCAAKGSRAPP